MDNQYICFTTLSTGNKRKLTEQDYNNFLQADGDDYIQPFGGMPFKKKSVMEIQDISEFVATDNFINDYHQPYLPAVNYNQIIKSASKTSHIEALAKGLKKAKAKFLDRPTPNIDNLLNLARARYLQIK